MNRTILITGASSGLGLELAKRFVNHGDFVYGISKTRKRWKHARKSIGVSKRFHLIQLDVTNERKVRAFFKNTHRKTGAFDILINDAGYSGRPVRAEKLPLPEFQKNLSHNLISAFLVCKHAIPTFRKKNKGLIINISSMAGKRAVPRLAAYSASKFGVVALSQAIAKENDDTNLKCITVCPGGMNTAMRAKLFGKKDARKQQSSDFVASIIMKIIQNKIHVESGGDIIIRHGKITAINPCPPA